MRKKQINKEIYYKSFNQDVVTNKNQDYKLKDNYVWINNNIIYRICSKSLYVFAYIVSFFYCRFFLHMKIINNKVLKKYKEQGFFLYANHTQPIGDVFMPAHVCKTKRTYVVVSQANLGIPIIGRILPMLGAIPTANSISGSKKFFEAINVRIKEKKCVVIYPEAHVWPYYTDIRPYETASFKLPINLEVPSFVMTTTYYKRRFGNKPGIKIFVDGPFFSDQKLDKKEQAENLKNKVYECMKKRSEESDYEYIKYIKGE